MGCLKEFSKRTILIWTLLCNIVYILWCSGFRNYHYGINDAALLYIYLAFSILTVLGVFLQKRAWVYFGIILYLTATWVSFWYFFAAVKSSTSEDALDVSNLNFVAKMVAVHWPLHIFHSMKDFFLCLVLSEYYYEQYNEQPTFSSGSTKVLGLLLFAKPAKDGQIVLLLAHVLAFCLMLAEFVNRLHDERDSVIVEENISYIRISCVRQTIIQLLLVIVILMITYAIARKNKVLMTMGYLFHACFSLYALIDMILMIRGQPFWFSMEKVDVASNKKLLANGVITFIYSAWLCRMLAMFVGGEKADSDKEEKANSRDDEVTPLTSSV